MTTIHGWDEVPQFRSETEEAAYWGSHDLSVGLLDQMQPDPDPALPRARARTRSVAIRFDDVTLKRMKTLAARRHKGYQTLLKEFVIERLYEEEKRDGLVG